jgi:hypothetical protein
VSVLTLHNRLSAARSYQRKRQQRQELQAHEASLQVSRHTPHTVWHTCFCGRQTGLS